MTGWQVALAVAAGAPGVLLGALVFARGPRIVGVLLVALGLLPLTLLSPHSQATGSPPHGLALVLAVMSVAGWVWLYLPPALLAAYLPDGRLGRGWWVLPAGWAVFLLTFHVAVALDPGTYGSGPDQIAGTPPLDVPNWVNAVLGVGSLGLLLGLLVGSAAHVVARFRRGDEVVRRQLKWFLLSIMLLPAVLVAAWATYLLTDVAGVVVVVGLLLVYVSLPVSVAIGVLRHDLFDVDTVVSRAFGYIVLTGGLVAVFATVTVVGGAVVGRGSDVAVAAATLVSAVLFGLLRRRVQAVVDARFDRGRRDALARLDRFLDEIRDGRADPEQIEGALQQALHDPALRVVYRSASDDDTWYAGDGSPSGHPEAVFLEVAVAGRLLACIAYDGAARRPRLLREALRRAHLPLELAHSRIALRQALAETRASRARIVEATDAERRRLERDLHDGAQQRLVAIGMSLQLAQQRAAADDPMRPVLAAAVRDLREAVVELRGLAGGVRPRGLDEGLPAAIRSLVRNSPIPVSVQVTTDPVTNAVATTAYYVAAEALANALKHAAPTTVAIDITRRDATLQVMVSDDGCGGASERPGSGLAGLRDRVAASGGDLVVTSAPGNGTRVEARLPCGS
ncbi:MAG TPA: sensor histidine kinase [Nocardioides sp.]|jgi:signal transduction histidine kinase